MNKIGNLFQPLVIRMIGALCGTVGFLLIALKPESSVFATALIGIGTVIISAGGNI